MIDDQHKGLINLTNDLFNHCLGDEESERAYFRKVIEDAVAYVKTHFATEEKLMVAVRFPGYQAHKREHDMFVMKVIDNIAQFKQGKPFHLAAFTKFLKEWVLAHIAVSDRGYFEYFVKIATRKGDGRLTVTAADIPLET
jgi:hemerythrin